MGILERQMKTRHTIPVDQFCGCCGYNLRTLPTVGNCPECGNAYDARASRMIGILRDEDINPPVGVWVVFVICVLLSGAFFYGAIKWRTRWNYAPAVLFLIFAAAYGRIALRRTARFVRHCKLLRQTREPH